MIDNSIVFALDLQGCELCGEPFCSKHSKHYSDCSCIGPDEKINPLDLLNNDKNEINIPSELWGEYKERYSKEDIKAAISSAIDEYNIPMPLRKISQDDAIEDFEALLNFDTSNMLSSGDLHTRYDYENPLSDMYITQSKVGNKSSDYYQQYNRFLCDSVNAPSPFRSWFNPKFRNGVLNALFTLKFKDVTMTTLRSAIGLRKYIASQFKPSVAKCIYNLFEAKNALDFSSGWGDRLAGFYASNAESYVGIDPNGRLFPKYKEQEAIYSKYRTKKTRLIESPAEDLNFKELGTFDFIFTSPPYFNIERYNQEENQSWKRYRKFDDWMNKFLFVVLEKAWGQLEDGGVMAINISDVYSGHRINKICDPMNNFISSLPNAKYLGCIGMKMSKRPNSKSCKVGGIFIEPVWIFSKGNNATAEKLFN